jgi:uncharacterized protein (DUF1330 family)
MPCQMIVHAFPNGNNPDGMKKYRTEGPAIVTQYGGRHISMGKPQVVEGDFQFPFVIISEWPSRDAALRFWNSPEYTALKKFREGTGDYQIYLVDTK